MIRKGKLYSRPKKLYESARIKEEDSLVLKYGLKNKREVWKTIAKVDYFRRRAKDLAKASVEEQQVLFGKLKALGLKADSISDVLALKIEDLLERRLPTIVTKKGLAKTVKHARQLVTHKNILIGGQATNSPSYLVPVSEEGKITLRLKKPAKKIKTEEPKEVSQ